MVMLRKFELANNSCGALPRNRKGKNSASFVKGQRGRLDRLGSSWCWCWWEIRKQRTRGTLQIPSFVVLVGSPELAAQMIGASRRRSALGLDSIRGSCTSRALVMSYDQPPSRRSLTREPCVVLAFGRSNSKTRKLNTPHKVLSRDYPGQECRSCSCFFQIAFWFF